MELLEQSTKSRGFERILKVCPWRRPDTHLTRNIGYRVHNTIFSGTVIVQTLADEDVERILEQHKSEHGEGKTRLPEQILAESSGGNVKDEAKEDVDHKNLFHFGRIEDVFDLFDPENTDVTSDLIEQKNPKNFLDADEVLLVKLFIQFIYEEVQASQADGVQLVLTIISEFGGLNLASKLDEDISRYVDKALLATAHDDAPLKRAAATVEAALDRRRAQERLGPFLHRVLAEAGIHLPAGPTAEATKSYLAINPVLVRLFASLKERTAALLPRGKSEL